MNYPPDMDPQCIKLCDAMNALKGITTFESCCGHGRSPFRIYFRVDDLKNLPPLLYWFDSCHSGYTGWKVYVTTDCGMSPATFVVEGPVGAFEEADQIALKIL